MVTNNFQIFKFSQFLKKLDSADAESVIIKLNEMLLADQHEAFVTHNK
jgi:hypothetical protein